MTKFEKKSAVELSLRTSGVKIYLDCNHARQQNLLSNRSGRLFDLTAVERGVPVGLNANHRDELGAIGNKKRLETGADGNFIAVNVDRTG